MIKSLLIIFLSFALLSYSLVKPYNSFADESDLDKELREKQEQIKKLEGQLSEAKAQEKTLSSQLKYIDGQVQLTTLKIAEAQFLIAKTQKELEELEGRIARLSASVDSIAAVLLNRIISTYKYGSYSYLDLVFSSGSFAKVLEKIKYLQVAQANDKKVLYQLQATKASFNDQKQEKQTKQTQQEKLKKDLENYSIQLTEQKKAKDELLKITKNNEEIFQRELARLRADTESISRALASRGVRVGDVGRGDRIASVGNSGCSTGPHLHLEVMTPARIEGGVIVGSENKVDPKPYLDSGRFSKPTPNYSGNSCSGSCNAGDITTKFGEIYFLGEHKGIDIADYFGTSIFAAEKGVAYAFQDSRACYLTGTAGKGVVVDHQNGIVTLYWHIP